MQQVGGLDNNWYSTRTVDNRGCSSYLPPWKHIAHQDCQDKLNTYPIIAHFNGYSKKIYSMFWRYFTLSNKPFNFHVDHWSLSRLHTDKFTHGYTVWCTYIEKSIGVSCYESFPCGPLKLTPSQQAPHWQVYLRRNCLLYIEKSISVSQLIAARNLLCLALSHSVMQPMNLATVVKYHQRVTALAILYIHRFRLAALAAGVTPGCIQ